jgi:hypothetical protein
MHLLDWVVGGNGLYNIMCAIGILFLPKTLLFSRLAQLHPTMFTSLSDQTNPVVRRVLAYWLLTYGFTRLAVVRHCDNVDCLVGMTYFLEAAAFGLEDVVHHTTSRFKAVWVCNSSILLGIWVVLRVSTGINERPG